MWGKKHFYFGDSISVGVRNLDHAVSWYQEKLGLRLTPLESEDFDAFLAFANDDETGLALVVIPPGETKANAEGHPILFTKKIAHSDFSSRGINVGPIQSDSGRNRFFCSGIWKITKQRFALNLNESQNARSVGRDGGVK
jgi:catechol 2,3-dioxygenase-like lactoylglutathione lyase family enzyme